MLNLLMSYVVQCHRTQKLSMAMLVVLTQLCILVKIGSHILCVQIMFDRDFVAPAPVFACAGCSRLRSRSE